MIEPTSDSGTERAPTFRWPVAHTVIVVALVVVYLVMAAVLTGPGHGPTAAVGLFLPLGPLLLLGLPWSLYFIIDPYAFDDAGPVVIELMIIGSAVVNVLLHGLYRHIRAGRPRA